MMLFVCVCVRYSVRMVCVCVQCTCTYGVCVRIVYTCIRILWCDVRWCVYKTEILSEFVIPVQNMSAAQPPRDPASWSAGYITGYNQAEKEWMKKMRRTLKRRERAMEADLRQAALESETQRWEVQRLRRNIHRLENPPLQGSDVSSTTQ